MSQQGTDLRQPDAYAGGVRRVLLVTLVLNLAVCLVKAGVGFWSNSLSVLADSVHSLTDAGNNIMALVVARWASRPPDTGHPYGHQKFEAVAALLIAALLGISCFEILRSALGRAMPSGQASAAVDISLPQLALLLIVLGVNIFVATYEARAGKRLRSALLQADAQHTLGDIWVTLGVIGSAAAIYWLGWHWLDVAVAVPVAAAVLWSGWRVIRGSLPWLVDSTAIDAEQIREEVMSVGGVLDCHEITSRGVPGRMSFIELHLVAAAPDVVTAHKTADEAERRLNERFGPAHVTVHLEPRSHIEPHH